MSVRGIRPAHQSQNTKKFELSSQAKTSLGFALAAFLLPQVNQRF
jgi:hypothetical protein